MIPKGRLIIIGGAEDKADEESTPDIKSKNRNFIDHEILEELIPKKYRRTHTIEIITTASESPEAVKRRYKKTFEALGYKKIGFIHIENRDQARMDKYINRLKKARAVLFSGGDQFRLSTILGGSPVIDTMTEKFRKDKDFVVAGTSAGAMVMTKLMLYRGDNDEALLKEEVQIASGFGFINCCIVDTHFVKRGRFGRLAHAVITNPETIGIGLGEDTALDIRKGREAECRGSGMVIIIDGTEVGHTNIAYAEKDTPVSIEGLKVHILSKGDRYEFYDKKFVPNKENIKKEQTRKKERSKKK